MAFLNGTLVPHIVTAEKTLYPELERLQQNAHSMTPMRREHADIGRLIDDLDRLHDVISERVPTVRETVALRRALFGLYALLKVHLAEEKLYLHIVQSGVSDDASAVLAAAMEHPIVAAP